MSQSRIAVLPPRAPGPMVDRDGRALPAWRDYFDGLARRVNDRDFKGTAEQEASQALESAQEYAEAQVVEFAPHNHEGGDDGSKPIDHGLALVGLGDDDHTQYAPNEHNHTGTAGDRTDQLDHGLSLLGLGDDDHPQYALNEHDHTGAGGDRTDQLDHGAAMVAASLLDDDHPQYLLLDGRSGGQTANGGVLAGESLVLRANSASTSDGDVESRSRILRANDAIMWEDLNFPVIALGVATAPAVVTIASTNIRAYSFTGSGVLADEVHGSVEIPHKWIEGSTLYPHIHWAPATAGAGGNVKWNLEYVWLNRSGTASTSTTISVVSTPSATAWEFQVSSFPSISGSGMTIGSQFSFRLYRAPADAQDTFTGGAVPTTIGLHFQSDTDGSRSIATK